MCEYYGLVVETVDEASVEDENTVIGQSIEPGELISAGDTITLTYSNGEDPSGTVPFTLSLPENATGRFVLDFIDANGVTLTSSSTINAAFSGVVTVNVEGTGTQRVTVILSNYATNQQATLGVYNFDFVNVTFTRVTEDILAAFQGVGGIAEETTTTTEAPATETSTTQPPTQPTTPPPTEPPTDPTTPAPTDPPTDPTTQAPTDPPATDAPAE